MRLKGVIIIIIYYLWFYYYYYFRCYCCCYLESSEYSFMLIMFLFRFGEVQEGEARLRVSHFDGDVSVPQYVLGYENFMRSPE